MNFYKFLLVQASMPLFITGINGQEKKPNVIIIMTDQQRAELCGREGFPLSITPCVDSLAHENVWFNKAYTTMPASVPARCSMMTGRFPSATHVRTNHNTSDINYGTDLIDVLKANGYKTGLIGKNHTYLNAKKFDYWSAYGHWGKEKKSTDSEKETAAFLNSKARGQWLPASPIKLEDQHPTKIVNEAIKWINSEYEQNNHFFVWISFPEPHNPYQVCEPYYSMFSPEKIPDCRTNNKDIDKKGEKYTTLMKLEKMSCPDLEKDLPRLRGNYLGMIRLIDDQIKKLITDLKEKDIYDNTIIVILSDHGDFCGEYGLMRKGAGLNEALTRIPMVWAGKGIVHNDAPLDACVSIADVFPTICSAIGSEIPLGVQGRSLWPILTKKEYPKHEFESIVAQLGYGGENVTLDDKLSFTKEGALTPKKIGYFDCLNSWTQSGASRMIRKGDWKMIIDSYGNGELYNLAKDPSEINNLYDNKKNASLKLELLNNMMKWELRLQDPLPVPQKRYIFKRDKNNYHFKN